MALENAEQLIADPYTHPTEYSRLLVQPAIDAPVGEERDAKIKHLESFIDALLQFDMERLDDHDLGQVIDALTESRDLLREAGEFGRQVAAFDEIIPFVTAFRERDRSVPPFLLPETFYASPEELADREGPRKDQAFSDASMAVMGAVYAADLSNVTRDLTILSKMKDAILAVFPAELRLDSAKISALMAHALGSYVQALAFVDADYDEITVGREQIPALKSTIDALVAIHAIAGLIYRRLQAPTPASGMFGEDEVPAEVLAARARLAHAMDGVPEGGDLWEHLLGSVSMGTADTDGSVAIQYAASERTVDGDTVTAGNEE